MSFFPSPSIRTELGQHSATVGRDAARMGAHGRRKKKVFIKDSEVEVGGEEEGGERGEEERLKWSRNASLLLSLPSNQRDKVMPVRAFVIPANPSSRYFIRFGIWLSALIRYSTGRRVNNWRAADNEKLSAPLYPLTITLPLSALAPLRLKHCVVFTCKGFHLLMIRPVFSASGDNVPSALWEISVHFFCFPRRDSLDLFEMSLLLSPLLFLSPLSFPKFFFLSFLSFIPHFSLVSSPFSPIHSSSISPVFLIFFRASQRTVRTPISLLHTLLTLRPSPPSTLPLPPPLPAFIHINTGWIAPLPNIHSRGFPFFFSPASPSSVCVSLSLYRFQVTPCTLIFSHPSVLDSLSLSLHPTFLPGDATFSLVFSQPMPSVCWCAPRFVTGLRSAAIMEGIMPLAFAPSLM